MEGLRTCTKALVDQKVEDKSSIQEIFEHLQKYWQSLTHKIETMNTKLKKLPDAKEQIDTDLHHLSAWLSEFEQSKRTLNSNELSTGDYKRLVDKLKTSLAELDEKRARIKNLRVHYEKAVGAELHLDNRYHAQVAKIEEKFDSIVKSVEPLRERTECLELALHVSQTSDTISNEIRNIVTHNTRKFLADDEDMFIQSAIDEQLGVLTKMSAYQAELNALGARLHQSGGIAKVR